MLKNWNIQIIILCTLYLSIHFSVSHAADAGLNFTIKNSSKPLSLSLVIDDAKKIAGMKVTIAYDKDVLILKGADKSKATGSFLHVVNDKYPGKIIIVMASAKGVSGVNVELCHIDFEKKTGNNTSETKISVIQLQLMDENLVEISGNLPDITIKN